MKNVTIYTDGGCRGNPGIGAYAAILKYISTNDNLYCKEITGGYTRTTNNQMELLAIIEAIKALKEPCNVTVYTDSQYIVNAFNKGWLSNWILRGWKTNSKEPVKNSEYWKCLLRLIQNHKFTIQWVKGHNGNSDNEKCDELVNRTMDEIVKNPGAFDIRPNFN